MTRKPEPVEIGFWTMAIRAGAPLFWFLFGVLAAGGFGV